MRLILFQISFLLKSATANSLCQTASYEDIVREINRLEENDPYTKGHNTRVSLYTAQILNGLHPEKRHTDVYLAANYHDVGKVRLDGDAFEALTCLIYSGCITQGKDNELGTDEEGNK